MMKIFYRRFSNAVNPTSFDVVVVGGGTSGLAVSSQLLRKGKKSPSVAIIEPSDVHYYQPGFTLVGGTLTTRDLYARPEDSLIPKGATWLKTKVSSFKPEENKVFTENGAIEYKFLVVASGLELKFDAIKGLREALDDPRSGVSTIYSFDHVNKTAYNIWHENLPTDSRPFRAVFTQPIGQIKCAGAPQKIMYLADSFWRNNGAREKTQIEFYTGLPVLFGQPEYAVNLNKICDKRNLPRFFQHDLIAVNNDKKEAVFVKTVGDKKEEVKVNYDMLHVTPKQGTHDFLRKSSLVDADGYVDVDKNSLQHKKYPNIFSLGDCAALPTSKTAAAITKQAPVVVQNLLAARASKPLKGSYSGYTSCALLTGGDELILAEFLGAGYGGQRKETFPFDQRKPRTSLFYLKRDIFPNIYFNGLVKGTWPPPVVYSLIGGIAKSQPPKPPQPQPAPHSPKH